jgi:superfamily II DNA or RNA helicase
VGVTATPIRLNGGGLGDVNDKLIVGVSAKWLIENKCLSPYDYYAPTLVDLSGVHTRGGEFVAEEIEKKVIVARVFGDVIKHYRQLANEKKAICYCASIEHSQRMAEAFTAAGINAAHIDGATPKAERAATVKAFRRGDIRILCNVDLISEGFDVPDCECSILLRPTKSLTLFIQQSMRCMRYRPGKRAIIIDHVGNYSRFGLPDQDRSWSLEPKSEEKKELKIKIKTCPKCFYTFPAPPPGKPVVCPLCGYRISQSAFRTVETVETKLIKIEGFKLDLRTPADCHTYAELLEYAKSKGYKPGWAYYQAKKRGLIA